MCSLFSGKLKKSTAFGFSDNICHAINLLLCGKLKKSIAFGLADTKSLLNLLLGNQSLNLYLSKVLNFSVINFSDSSGKSDNKIFIGNLLAIFFL